jgi:DNA-binding transcriptional ArsR family regulator
VSAATGTTGAADALDDEIWSAIGDPTRRRLLDLLLAEGVGTPTSLSDRLPITRQAVTKHLGVLDRAGLVHATPLGRERRYEVDEAQLARAVRQLSQVGSTWDARLNRIKRIAEQIQRQKNQSQNLDTQSQDNQNSQDQSND